MMRRKSAWSGGASRTGRTFCARSQPFGGGPLPEAVQAERFRDAAAGETVLTIDTAPCLFLGTHAVLRLNGEHYVEEIGKNRILL